MSALAGWLASLPWLLGLAVVAWLVCTARRNAGLVDIFWPLFVSTPALVLLAHAGAGHPRARLVLALLALWALRLAVHLARRNWNAPEDRRYQAIRARNEPHFVWKSLYLVFGLQALLAWIVALPVVAALASAAPPSILDIAGGLLCLTGIGIEALADAQLAAFRASPAHRGQVHESGLWRYSRHPNYFGEFCAWWGLYLVALGGGAWWSVASPLLMSVLLLRVSGVTLLEADIGARRPGYAAYVARTNAFFPGPRRTA
jgi:steroid 5-alpha reductase family enzyme